MEEKKYLKWYNKVGYGSGDIAGNVVYAFLTSFVMIYIGCAVTLVACFAVPTSLGKTAQYTWFFLAYTLLNGIFYTANNIAYSALTSLITKNSKERVQMGSYRFIFAFSTSLLIQSITVGFVDRLDTPSVIAVPASKCHRFLLRSSLLNQLHVSFLVSSH